jgi:hypothetical protein
VASKFAYVVRLWVPDRPGALGAVASRIGAARGDVVGIDILERGGGRAIDELVVELPSPHLVDLLVAEVSEVDGVDVEDVRPVATSLHDPRVDALEMAARLVGAEELPVLVDALATDAARAAGAVWAAVLDCDSDEVLATTGEVPPGPWLAAFVAGSRFGGADCADDVVWAPLPRAALALVLGRDGTPFRARERRQAAALARIADTRWRELHVRAARRAHPAGR